MMSKKESKAKVGNLHKVCSHYTYDGNVHLNKALHEIWFSKHAKPCHSCSKETAISENSEKKKKKKKKNKESAAAKVISEIWVCLTCQGHFCEGAQNHIRTHTQETGHWWAAKNNDPSSVYCFKCGRDVLVWLPEDHKEVAQIDLRFFITGLKTLGQQSCFNAVLQNILSLNSLRKEILETEFPKTAHITIALRELFVGTNTLLWGLKWDENLDASTLLSHMDQIDPDFRIKDCEETVSCFLNALNGDEKKAWAEAHEVFDSTLVDSIFGGECSISTSCSECSESMTEKQRFFHLSLPFVQRTDNELHISIEECLKVYTDPQQWVCEKCTEASYNGSDVSDKAKGFGAGSRRIWIHRPPQVLALHLKRQESDEQSKKLKIHVNPQENLDIRPFMDPSCGVDNSVVYRLAGVVQHDETSGRYVANVRAISYLVKVPSWFEAIDLQVKRKALKSVEGEPHLLFYRKVSDQKNPLQPEKSDKVIVDDGVVKKGKEPEPLEQIGGKIPLLAERSHPMETHEDLPNLPRLVELSHPVENLPLQVEGSGPLENLPMPFEGSDPLEIRANVVKPLPNLGLTCFFNVTLQCLLSLDSLRSKMLGPNVPTGLLFSSLKELFIQTSPLCHEAVPLKPQNLLKTIYKLCPQLQPRSEEDSYQLLILLLDQLNMEEEAMAQKPMDMDTIVDSLFRGSVYGTVSSNQCPHKSTGPEEKYLHISLCIPKGCLEVSIEELWTSYTDKVELSKDWHCPDCKADRNASRKVLVVKAPPVLVVTLNNYEFVSSAKKLEVNVHFKEMFDIRPFMEQRSMEINSLYRLVGVIEHIGDAGGGAHYVTYVRANKMEGPQHSNTKSWFYASDLYIRGATLDEVLGCKPYMLFYEMCAADLTSEDSQLAINMLTQFSANPIGEEPHADSNMQQDGVCLWEYPRTRNLYRKARNKFDQVNDTVGQRVGVFLDRLKFYLKQAAINFAKKLVGLAEDKHLVLTNTARKRMELLASVDDMDSSLELKFLEMPRVHRLLKHYLSPPLTQEMYVYGNYQKAVRTPVPAKCSLLQRLLADVITGHRVGLSWNGEFTPDDIEVMDDRVFIAKEPKRFSIHPVISQEMLQAMGRDFFVIAKSVLVRFRYPEGAVSGKFLATGAYIPYLETFYDMLTNMDTYKEWWLDDHTAEAVRHLIENNPFLKPGLARSNLWSGIFTASRSHDAGDWTIPFKVILDMHSSSIGWLDRLYQGGNRMVQCVIEHKDTSLVGTNTTAAVKTAAETVPPPAEGTNTTAAVTTAAETVPPPAETTPAAADTVTPGAPETVVPATAADPAAATGHTYCQNCDEFLFEIMRHLAQHGSNYSLLRQRGSGPRVQMMRSLEEPELAAALILETELVKALAELLKHSAMKKGLLKSVWDCYKNCNHPRGP